MFKCTYSSLFSLANSFVCAACTGHTPQYPKLLMSFPSPYLWTHTRMNAAEHHISLKRVFAHTEINGRRSTKGHRCASHLLTYPAHLPPIPLRTVSDSTRFRSGSWLLVATRRLALW
ncbi:hypothetical protein DFH06DRAFT_317361 [Mycena polygramma]|nr:hypothetical protein DFH06DRAFT_317361 [Mycena polygramma]